MNLKTKRKATTKLDFSEQKIEENADSYRPVTKKNLQSVEAIIERTRKSKKINILANLKMVCELQDSGIILKQE